MEGLELPDFPYDAAAGIIIDSEAASAFEPLFDRLGGYAGQVVLAKDYLRALRAGVDAIAAPNLSGVPGLFLMNGVGESALPTSLQLTGRALGEESLLAIGIPISGAHPLSSPAPAWIVSLTARAKKLATDAHRSTARITPWAVTLLVRSGAPGSWVNSPHPGPDWCCWTKSSCVRLPSRNASANKAIRAVDPCSSVASASTILLGSEQ